MAAAPPAEQGSEDEAEGVLLYYCYAPARLEHQQQQQLAEWFEGTLAAQQLRGRVRVAADGINVTLGGRIAALKAHMQQLRALPLFQSCDIDFKLASSGGALSDQVQAETGFTTLQVRQCKELVSLGPLAEGRADPSAHGAPHLSPRDFHAHLLRASGSQGAQHDGGGGGEPQAAVLVDARNVYETRIGHFDVPGVRLLDPRTRCFSDLPAWLERHRAALANKRIFMYCTGGVRCERASAYVREMGPQFQDVYQLHGGIQRYLEAFPDGGLFRGKNFVYDDRVAVGPAGDAPSSPPPPGAALPTAAPATASRVHSSTLPASGAPPEGGGMAEASPPATQPPRADAARVVGRCAVCARPWDDYGARARCRRCRLLMLVCAACCCGAPPAGGGGGAQDAGVQAAQGAAAPPPGPPSLLCELCVERAERGKEEAAAGAGDGGGGAAEAVGRKLRILCLHGFRHTASTFQARSRGFLGKLGAVADVHCLDAPFLLPLYLKQAARQGAAPLPDDAPPPPASQHSVLLEGAGLPPSPEQGHAPPQQHQQPQQQSEEEEGPNVSLHAPAPAPPPLDPTPAPGAERAGDEGLRIPRQGHAPSGGGSDGLGGSQGPWRVGMPAPESARRRAWMVSPGLLEMQPRLAQESRWEMAPPWVDQAQHLQQTEGLGAALDAVARAARDHGPFDGVLGFSQGAGIAALLCAHQQQQQHDVPSSAAAAPLPPLRFAILVSGYVPPGAEAQRLLSQAGALRVPSLHIYSTRNGPGDAISAEDSEALAELFERSQRSVYCHTAGHTLPSNRAVMAATLRFLAAQRAAG